MWMGTSYAFIVAILLIVVWIVTGPVFHFSDTWQLVINTGTTIITFLMVFLIQNSQNRDSKLIQLKLDELIRALEGAKTSLINMDEMSEGELETLRGEFVKMAEEADDHLEEAQEHLHQAEDRLKERHKVAGATTASRKATAKTAS